MKKNSDLFWTGPVLRLPFLGSAMLAGLQTSVVKVITRDQEISLTFCGDR
ncbi:hypothetical protein [Variovorax sp. GT1P44]